MLKKFTLKNFKNFKNEICLDFSKVAGYQFNTDCVHDGLISKMIIYGRNATGKTNLCAALIDIAYTVIPEVQKFLTREEFLPNVGSGKNASEFSYEYVFGKTTVTYRYSKSSRIDMCKELLMIDGKVVFDCDFKNSRCSFPGLDIIGAETANRDMYMRHLDVSFNHDADAGNVIPFLRWLINNVSFERKSIVMQMYHDITGMGIIATRTFNKTGVPLNFFKELEKKERLSEFEDFLKQMGVDCRLALRKLPDEQYQLYFSYDDRLLPFFETASSGTMALFDLYRRVLFFNRSPALLLLDEFDAFYHYELSERLVVYLKKRYPKCQIVMTTHNTNLMTNCIMRPDCLFILSCDGRLTALCDATGRELREGHNLEKMYKAGEFDAYE